MSSIFLYFVFLVLQQKRMILLCYKISHVCLEFHKKNSCFSICMCHICAFHLCFLIFISYILVHFFSVFYSSQVFHTTRIQNTKFKKKLLNEFRNKNQTKKLVSEIVQYFEWQTKHYYHNYVKSWMKDLTFQLLLG